MPTRFINELNYDKKPYDSFDMGPAKIGYINDLADIVTIGGSFYASGTKTTAAINTAYNADFTNTAYADGVSVVASPTSLTGAVQVATAGTYSFDYTLQLFKNNTTTEGSLTAWIAVKAKNDATSIVFADRIDYSANTMSMAITNQTNVLSLHSHLVLNAGDKVCLMYAANSTDMQIRATAAATPYPAIASISLEVDRIR